MSISHKNNRALKRVLQNSIRGAAHSETAKQASKPANEPAYSLCADIPESYNDAYVRAIPKDPQNSFVYWEMPKEQANGRALGGKGAAHVGNGDAHKIREELERQGANNGGNGSGGNNVNNGNNNQRCQWQDHTRQYLRNDNYHACWQDNAHQQHHWHGNRHHRQWNDNNYHEYCQDNNAHHVYGCGEHQHNCHDDNRSSHRHDNHCHILWNDNSYHERCLDNYSHDDNCRLYSHAHGGANSAFYAMLDSLIAQCNRYLLECRQGASGLHLHIPSSGEFYNGANSIIPYSAPSFSSGIFYNAGAKNINAEKYP